MATDAGTARNGTRAQPVTARGLFGTELRRLRQARSLSQEQLAAMVHQSRALIAAIELGERWPPRDLAERCDAALHGDGALSRLWPLVDQERQAARLILTQAGSPVVRESAGDRHVVRLSELRELVLRLAALTGTDLSVLSVPHGSEERDAKERPGR